MLSDVLVAINYSAEYNYCLGITELLLMKNEVSAASACKLAT